MTEGVHPRFASDNMMDEEDVVGSEDLRGFDFYVTPTRSWSGIRRRRLVLGGVVLLCVVLVIIVASATSSGNQTPPPAPQVSLTEEEDKALHSIIEDAMVAAGLSTDNLLSADSYLYKAFDWLADSANVGNYDDAQKIQRFALACFYYSTYQVPTKYSENPDPWFQSDGWMTDADECDWFGISCTKAKMIHSISLEKNKLAGNIPPEIALMGDDLKGLVLTSNGVTIHERDSKIFESLSVLEKLDLSDNYVSSHHGIPSSLSSCTELRKLVLSYNTLQGPLENGVLQHLTKLTHLEIESNYLTGKIETIGQLSNLEYVYLRSNSLNSKLDFLKTGNLNNLTSIWLDGNDITHTIPTEVGQLSDLESFSIANAKLAGTIPSEFGLLTNLKRLWLFNNTLTGHIPSQLDQLVQLEVLKVEDNSVKGYIPTGLCTILALSDYEHKTITADCDHVKCDCCNCTTERADGGDANE